MNIQFSQNGWDDYVHWQQTDKSITKKINQLIKDICRSPYDGIGKPEPLKFDLSGCWSRRINKEHRLVYTVRGGTMFIVQCRFHYEK